MNPVEYCKMTDRPSGSSGSLWFCQAHEKHMNKGEWYRGWWWYVRIWGTGHKYYRDLENGSNKTEQKLHEGDRSWCFINVYTYLLKGRWG